MIVTLTPNPSTDRTVSLAGPLERGAVLRLTGSASQAGGKGVNISRACVSAGVPTVAVFPAPAEDPFVTELLAAGIDARPVPGPAPRTNIAVTEPDGTTTKLNSAGAPATPALLDALVTALEGASGPGGWVVLAGSLPPATPASWYRDVVARLRERGCRVAVDTSDEPLVALVAGLPGPGAPDLMKPNGEELAQFTGGDAATLEADPEAAAAAARTLLDGGVRTVLATLGGHGAVLVTPEGSWHAAPPPTTVVSTVGAGDSSLFGYLLGDLRGLDPAHRLALAVAYGSAAAGLPGTTIPRPEQVHPDLVPVRELFTTQESNHV
ncbi:1-phosphofructokinase family hexose kinase [Nocardioides bruguierae]|uniref:1-phosphofructokinase family hexose kinase n=1 Tax=Nocardioides bruguierae TaxID=2945102 RepID=A0A9X2DAN0_9ACTN|nr:1-phosphofructokinase family hexose kinase [Nocardioides bruguierae]MCL8027093.1 1-phosphofructokinase family hexose kinase [Nocardioides bruguierae]MCM0622231.1 1-phosphofructokinase family hexose kinase [Nocardioides bruguierae]